MVTDEVIVFELSEHTVVTVHKKTPTFRRGQLVRDQGAFQDSCIL